MIKEDKFLSAIFKRPCGSLDINNFKDLDSLNLYYFLYSKTSYGTNFSLKANFLNFYLAEISLNFLLKVEDLSIKNSNFEFALDTDLLDIKSLAFKSFTFDRFHQDPNISNYIASKIKSIWIENYFKGLRGDKCFIKRSNTGKVIGFLLTKVSKDSIKIDLLAIDKIYRGKGYARELINSMLFYYKDNKKNFSVSTQFENKPSSKLYTSLGFKIVNSVMVWHFFNRKL